MYPQVLFNNEKRNRMINTKKPFERMLQNIAMGMGI